MKTLTKAAIGLSAASAAFYQVLFFGYRPTISKEQPHSGGSEAFEFGDRLDDKAFGKLAFRER